MPRGRDPMNLSGPESMWESYRARFDAVELGMLAVVAAGVILRVRQYIFDRSLWLDESFIALNLIRRSWSGLLEQLDFNQGAAPGFLLTEKLAASIDRGELMLRAPSLILGVAAVGCAVPVARRMCSRGAAIVACAIVALAPSLVYYSSELKQYSGDVAATLALTWMALLLYERPTLRRAAIAAGVGLAAVLLSQAAVLVAFGEGVVLVAASLGVRRDRLRRPLVAAVAVWAGGAVLVVLHALHAASSVRRSYGGSNSLLGGGSSSGGRSVLSPIPTSIAGDLGLPTAGAGFWAVVFVLGAIALAGAVSLVRRRPVPALLVLAPPFVTLCVSLAGQYPVTGRSVLFLIPAAGVLLAEGCSVAVSNLRNRFAAAVVGLAIVVFLFFDPARADVRALASPVRHEELRTVIERIAADRRPGDRLYVAYAAQYPLAYYSECGCLEGQPW
ncbi:MAG: glycosyltransferase family 39 protein, partial [Actinobacteria bacterium]|nr:glycosyltransferase family 39 protein [Actinomycetota bacterium]